MKRNSIKLLVLSAVSSAVLAFLTLPAGIRVSAVESQTSGRAVYVKNCARCHGSDGKGQSELGKSLDTPDLTQERPSSGRIVSVVKNGDGSMPAFGKKLTAKQISAVSSYVKTLK
jgi:cbb3-type cytochrome c oxidase subunit III